MVATFKLCSEQLSSQDHYDYVRWALILLGGLILEGAARINVKSFA
jgi:hypothetical protein